MAAFRCSVLGGWGSFALFAAMSGCGGNGPTNAHDESERAREAGVDSLDAGDEPAAASALSSDASLDAALVDGDASQNQLPSTDASAGCDTLEQSIAIAGATHVNGDLVYPDPPPTGGDHNSCWADWGVHQEAVPDERWVHNLEHGGVVYLVHCPEGCAAELSALQSFVTGRDRALLTTYDALPTKFAVVSWGHRWLSNCFDLATMQAFYATHVDHAPESESANPPSQCH